MSTGHQSTTSRYRTGAATRRRVGPALDDQRRQGTDPALAPTPPGAARLLGLQRAAGNAAVAALVAQPQRHTAAEHGRLPCVQRGAVEVLTQPGRPLCDRLSEAVRLGITPEELTGALAKASVAERAALAEDPACLKSLEERLGVDDLLDLLVAVRADVPSPARRSAEDVQAEIADKLSDHLFASDVDIAEHVAVLRGEAFKVAVRHKALFDPTFFAEFVGANVPIAEVVERSLTTITGFNDEKGRIVINADLADTGTLVHEGVHRHAAKNVLATHGNHMDEAFTEYFTRQVTGRLSPPIARAAYEPNYTFAQKLVERIGEQPVGDAYFQGRVKLLATAFEEHAAVSGNGAAVLQIVDNAVREGQWKKAGAAVDWFLK